MSSGRNSKKEQKQGILEQAGFDQMLTQSKPMLLIESGNYNYLKSNRDRTSFSPNRVIPSSLHVFRDWLKRGFWGVCNSGPQVIALSLHVCRDWLIEGSTATLGTWSGMLDHSYSRYMVGVIKKR